MDELTRQIVWQSTLDGKYLVRVLRVSDSTGTLQVLEEQTVLMEESVGLAYGAIFGPDIDDVEDWQQIASGFVDSLSAARGK